MEASNWDRRACAAIDALRAGVVNGYIAEQITYGRDREVAQLEATINERPEGSCQVVLGRYGTGKSHLCEVLASRFENAGYAVARLEMGASSGRAENPHAVLETIGRTITVRVHGRRFRGSNELGHLLKAVEKPTEPWSWDFERIQRLHKQIPGEDGLLRRYEVVRELYATRPPEYIWNFKEPRLINWIPTAMTASNLAVAEVNKTAHHLRKVGVKGVVLLFDEAERSNWASSYYRAGRARDLMLGFALASGNMGTSHLKHFQNDTSQFYRPYEPSRMHAVFWFTFQWGLATEIARGVGVKPLVLAPLDTSTLEEVEGKVIRLYHNAYRCSVELRPELVEYVRAASRNDDTRGLVRRLIAALDSVRLNGDGHA